MNPCTNCGKPRPERAWRLGWARGYCGTCYHRWRSHGYPAEGPPPSGRPPRADRIARLEDYAELRSWGVPRQQAADRLGVSVRTVLRYERAMAGAS